MDGVEGAAHDAQTIRARGVLPQSGQVVVWRHGFLRAEGLVIGDVHRYLLEDEELVTVDGDGAVLLRHEAGYHVELEAVDPYHLLA